MNHPNSSEWIALVRGEHSWLVAARLRRHLKHCPHCAVELKEITNMLAAAKPKEAVASKSLADKTRDALPLSPSQGRKLRSLGLVGGVALIAGVTLFFAVPGGPLRPTPSFAQVEATMEKIQTVHWTEMEYPLIWNEKKKQFVKGRIDRYDCWADMNALKISRVSMKGQPLQRSDFSTREGNILYIPDAHMSRKTSQYINMQRDKNGTDSFAKLMRDMVILSTKDSAHVEEFKDVFGKKNVAYLSWRKDIVNLEGRSALKFSREMTISSQDDVAKENIVVWADSKTLRILRREVSHVFSGNRRTQVVAENFSYNEKIPEGVLEVPTPKVGEFFHYMYLGKRKGERVPEMRANEQARKKVIEEAIRAYARKDTTGFLALWDFDAVPQAKRASRKAEARALVSEQKPYRSWRVEKVMSAHPGPPVYVRKSEADPFPPPPRAPETTVDVNVRGWVTTTQKSKPYPALSTFTLTKRSGQWKIQQARLSTEALPEWSGR